MLSLSGRLEGMWIRYWTALGKTTSIDSRLFDSRKKFQELQADQHSIDDNSSQFQRFTSWLDSMSGHRVCMELVDMHVSEAYMFILLNKNGRISDSSPLLDATSTTPWFWPWVLADHWFLALASNSIRANESSVVVGMAHISKNNITQLPPSEIWTSIRLEREKSSGLFQSSVVCAVCFRTRDQRICICLHLAWMKSAASRQLPP